MLTKRPDYTISELGYPQWQQQQQPLCEDKLYTKYRPQLYNTSYCSSTNSSPNRLLPLRETLDDYYKRIVLSEQRARVENCTARRGRDLDDVVAQQKRHKNQWNVQQQQQQQRAKHNQHIRNQNCRDKAQATAAATTTTTTTTPPTTATTTTTTFVTGDLNSF